MARKKADEALKLSEEQFRRAIKDAPIPIIMQAEDGQVLQLSRTWTELTGYTINHVPDLDSWLTKAAYGEGANAVRDHMHKLFAGHEKSLNVEFPIRALDGSVRYWSFSASSPGMLQDGRRFIIGMAVDITERKKAEEALKETRRDLNRAQAVGKIGSWRLDIQRNVLLWSDENHRIFGVHRGTPMTYESFLSIVHPEDRKCVDREWKAGLRGEPYDIEHRLIVDGEVKWVHEKAELEFDEDGKLRGGFGTTQEITDLVEMRHRLEDASSKLQEFANNMEQLAKERAEKLKDAERLAAIGATAGMVGHDIRNPLQAIVGDLYLARSDLAAVPESEAKEGLQESLEEIEKNVGYIDKVVQDLQDFAKPIKPSAKKADVEALCQELLFRNGVPENINTFYEVEEKAKLIISDPDLLKRILSNLVNNAVQAMPNGGKLEIRAFREKSEIVISVQDTGVGIPGDVKPKLFTPLFTTKSKGQGFGLAVVKRMTEALGGAVTFESEVGKGTKFIVRLPPQRVRR